MANLEMSMNEKRQASNPFQFAILVDEQGREIAITEEMIQQACADLAKRCQFPAARKAA
ncbi:PA1571 family protein [Amnimonas aquatica]|uniref:PA1571 family protein n=1 Tax=Amnimonas aquatica TaxID=2094561 RepID=UPI001304F658|nr:PA1571 family protein [Amnimonas aquatica]